MAYRTRDTWNDHRSNKYGGKTMTATPDKPDWPSSVPALIEINKEMPWMGTVTNGKGDNCAVRIDCEHAAPLLRSRDCRFGCEAAKQKRETER